MPRINNQFSALCVKYYYLCKMEEQYLTLTTTNAVQVPDMPKQICAEIADLESSILEFAHGLGKELTSEPSLWYKTLSRMRTILKTVRTV